MISSLNKKEIHFSLTFQKVFDCFLWVTCIPLWHSRSRTDKTIQNSHKEGYISLMPVTSNFESIMKLRQFNLNSLGHIQIQRSDARRDSLRLTIYSQIRGKRHSKLSNIRREMMSMHLKHKQWVMIECFPPERRWHKPCSFMWPDIPISEMKEIQKDSIRSRWDWFQNSGQSDGWPMNLTRNY
jgi:hypothetical protein